MKLTSPVPLLAIPERAPPRHTRRITIGVLAASAGAAAIGAAVLTGWALGLDALRTLGTARGAMNPLTALCLLVLATALACTVITGRPVPRAAASTLAAAVSIVGGITLVSGLTGAPLQLDDLLFGDAMLHTPDRRSNLMAPVAATIFLMLGVAVVCAGRRTRSGDAVAQTLAVLSLALAQVALIGHAYQSLWFESVGRFSRMVPHTAVAVSLIAAGVLGARPESGVTRVLASTGPGGAMARRMLPAGMLLPALLGWLVVLARQRGLVVPQVADTLFVLATTLSFAVLVAWNAVQLQHSHEERERTGAALRDSEARFRLLAELGQDMVYIVSVDGNVLYASPSSERMLGFTPLELARMPPLAMVHPDDRARVLASQETLFGGAPISSVTYRALHKAGHHVWLEALGRSVVDAEGRVLRLHVASRDITERKMYEAQLEAARRELEAHHTQLLDANARLEALATLDGLTGLKNRRAFTERLNDEVSRSRRTVAPVSLLLLDIDHFKQFNDSYGHPRGDEVLRDVARILQHGVRDTDLAARYGGEEFAVILPGSARDDALVLAERLRHAVEHAGWLERVVTVSVGVATLSGTVASADLLVEHADRALYQSKAAGRNVIRAAED